ncbi:hypothetical protein D3C87_1580660 [compost metagenome]
MFHHHPGFLDALGSGGTDIVVAENIQHRGAGKAQNEGGRNEAECDGWQGQVIHALEEACARTAISRHREHIEPDSEELHEDQAKPEARNARRQHRNGCRCLIHEGTAPVSGIDADGKRDGTGDQQRKDRQEEGRFRPIQKRRSNRHVEEDRLAEITAQQLPDIVDILHAERLI